MLSEIDFFLFWVFVLFVFIGLVAFTYISYRLSSSRQDPSPFTGAPLRYGREIAFFNLEKIAAFLKFHESSENRLFNIQNASFCRDTGRIFPDSVNWLGNIRLPKDYLQMRRAGNYVSWGSLSREQKQAVIQAHGSLMGFQTDYSSSDPSPRMLRPDLALLKPGPLYVDISSFTLLGWQEVPETPFEVLIVKPPLKIHYQGESIHER